MSTNKPNATESAIQLAAVCKKLKWDYEVRGSILTISKAFDGTLEGFTKCDTEYYSILSKLPTTTPGSTWGTDGGGIGALSAIKKSLFTMNKSGGSKRVLKALTKLSK